MKTNNEEPLQVIWVKSIIYSIVFIMIIVFMIITPKKVFSDDLSFKLAASMAITHESNLLLYDYQVYGSEQRFTDGLEDDLDDVMNDFKERNELLAVKINGNSNSIEVREDYIYIVSTETPEMNIEYYLVKDMSFNDITIPVRTFIMLFNDISVVINNVYRSIFWVFSIIIFIPVTIKLTRNIFHLTEYYKKRKNV